MSNDSNREQAVDTLQELGLKEYEAKCFVALSRLPQGTAKEISDISDVPRTRVYDAARVLESKGLVEVQHTKPQEFRAVDIEEAVATLEKAYQKRMTSLQEALEDISPVQIEDSSDVDHEVWALSDSSAITNRLCKIVSNSSDDVVLVLSDETDISERLAEEISSATAAGVTVFISVLSESRRDTIAESLPSADVFVSELGWLMERTAADEPRITRIALVDDEKTLISSGYTTETAEISERATYASGFNNGMVIIVRRLLRNRPSANKTG